MSWTTEYSESNSFKVKNPREVAKVLEQLGFSVEILKDNYIIFWSDENAYLDENAEVTLSLKPVKVEGEEEPTHFLGVSSLDITPDLADLGLTENDIIVQHLFEYLQDELLDENQYIKYIDVGYEGRLSGNSSPFGDVTVIGKCGVKFASLYQIADELVKELTLNK